MPASRFRNNRFSNREPATRVPAGTFPALIRDLTFRRRQASRPPAIPLERPDFHSAAGDLAATWLGHATVLFEVDGARILADPMWSDRASPVRFTGPRRLHRAPVTIDEIGPLDAILISHDHYDHFDRDTLAQLAAVTGAPILVPRGLARYVAGWGVSPDRVREFSWYDEIRVAGVRIACTPARHFSGRGLRRNLTLWASWSIIGPRHRAFFGGDTGYTSAFGEIAGRYGAFDLTALPIGAYDAAWPDVHMTPEQAITAHGALSGSGGSVLLPIHWGTFNLARHGWAEPIERLTRAAGSDVILATPPPGRRLDLAEVDDNNLSSPWWR